MDHNHSFFIAILFMCLGSILIGSSAIFVRLSDLGPITTGFYRMLFALPLLAAWIQLERKKFPHPVIPFRSDTRGSCPDTTVECDGPRGLFFYLFNGQKVSSWYENGYCHPNHKSKTELDDMCNADSRCNNYCDARYQILAPSQKKAIKAGIS